MKFSTVVQNWICNNTAKFGENIFIESKVIKHLVKKWIFEFNAAWSCTQSSSPVFSGHQIHQIWTLLTSMYGEPCFINIKSICQSQRIRMSSSLCWNQSGINCHNSPLTRLSYHSKVECKLALHLTVGTFEQLAKYIG